MPCDSPLTPTSGRPQSPLPQDSPLFQTHACIAVQRWCGARIPPGRTAFGVTFIPQSLEDLFRGGLFCSVVCIRAFWLEPLEILDVLRGSNRYVTGLSQNSLPSGSKNFATQPHGYLLGGRENLTPRRRNRA